MEHVIAALCKSSGPPLHKQKRETRGFCWRVVEKKYYYTVGEGEGVRLIHRSTSPPWGVICQLVSKKREKLASEFIFNKDVKKNSFLHFMYTNYITTDSWFVPKERLSLLLLCFFLSFFLSLFIASFIFPLPPLFTHFYYLREETQGEERKIYVHSYVQSLTLCFLFPFPSSRVK